MGKQDQIREKLAISDVMLMPSELETFGLAALEGMACEVVPVAARSGGVPELIEHGVTGFMADVGDVDTMARYAIELLSDESALRAMGKRARAAAQAKILLQQDHSALRRVLPEGAGAHVVGAAVMSSSGLGRIGSRKRTSVPPPSRLSIIILAASP